VYSKSDGKAPSKIGHHYSLQFLETTQRRRMARRQSHQHLMRSHGGLAHPEINLWGDHLRGTMLWEENAGCMDKFMHILSGPWKFLSLLCPPPAWGGGWPCFTVALLLIAFTTALVDDLASHFGCCVGVPNMITALTLVACGTSLPDLFVSMRAAVQDSNADNTIGNVTGSNVVNVFFGLGLPWFMGALRWQGYGANDEWHSRVPAHISTAYPGGVFYVAAGDLTFSVLVFAGCACLTILFLMYRRRFYGAELGGKGKKTAAAIMMGIYFLFFIPSMLKALKVIPHFEL